MQGNGIASLWVGSAGSEEALDAFVATGYTDDGDAIRSAFSEAFGIRYDEDFLERMFHEKPSASLKDLLIDHSYGDQIADRFMALCGERFESSVNAVILVYDFEHGVLGQEVYHRNAVVFESMTSGRKIDDAKVAVRFIGSVQIVHGESR